MDIFYNILYLGQDEYSIFPTQYSVDIDGYVLVYSIDSEQSFDVVQVKISIFYLPIVFDLCSSNIFVI